MNDTITTNDELVAAIRDFTTDRLTDPAIGLAEYGRLVETTGAVLASADLDSWRTTIGARLWEDGSVTLTTDGRGD